MCLDLRAADKLLELALVREPGFKVKLLGSFVWVSEYLAFFYSSNIPALSVHVGLVVCLYKVWMGYLYILKAPETMATTRWGIPRDL
jgi:hypothetical protein